MRSSLPNPSPHLSDSPPFLRARRGGETAGRAFGQAERDRQAAGQAARAQGFAREGLWTAAPLRAAAARVLRDSARRVDLRGLPVQEGDAKGQARRRRDRSRPVGAFLQRLQDDGVQARPGVLERADPIDDRLGELRWRQQADQGRRARDVHICRQLRDSRRVHRGGCAPRSTGGRDLQRRPRGVETIPSLATFRQGGFRQPSSSFGVSRKRHKENIQIRLF